MGEAMVLQRRPRVSAEERAQWVSQYGSSQLPASKFAEQHGLRIGTLQRWIREERQRGGSQREAPGFAELQLPAWGTMGAWAAEVVLPGGIVVRLGATAEPSWMQSLLASLRPVC
jgi:transposase-like protein